MIKIIVVSYNNEAPESIISAEFGAEPATIGRNVENFLVLPDPKHLVSRTQAKIWSTGSQHFLSNLSAANPVFINGKEIQAETEVEIHAGDQIQAGLYILRAEAVAVDEVNATGLTEVVPESESESEPEPEPEKVSEESSTNTQPVQRLLPGRINPRPQPPQFLLRPETQAVEPSAPETSEPSPLVQPAELVDSSAPAPAPATLAAAKPDVAKTIGNVSNISNASELIQAFLNGAGLPQVNLASGLTVDLMETLGKFMASSVQGAMDELSQRALLKREVKAEVTMVVLRENNPLKFFPDSKTVLTQMLRKKMPGFMAPAEAMEDAFFDIRTHQMGVAAGSRAVTESILKTLQPASVEAHLGSPGLLDQINPGRRKAAMWDQFSELFDTISAAKKDEFQSLFGKEFLLAYEKEVEKAELNR